MSIVLLVAIALVSTIFGCIVGFFAPFWLQLLSCVVFVANIVNDMRDYDGYVYLTIALNSLIFYIIGMIISDVIYLYQ